MRGRAPGIRRRRVAVAVTFVAGTVLLGLTLNVRPGDPLFYVLATTVAATWAAGGLLSGPLPLGHRPLRDSVRRSVFLPVAVGLLLGGLFLAGAVLVRATPTLRDQVGSVLEHADRGAAIAIAVVAAANGAAEEIFFRGAVYAAFGHAYPVAASTAVYVVATFATGNPMLAFAAGTVGVVLGLQRRVSGGILAPALTHITWSMLMLFALPPLIRTD